jgi:RNA-binding protein
LLLKNLLTGAQKKYLRGLAHSLKPLVIIGQKGMADAVVSAIEEAFNAHELIKIKFSEFKEKAEKQALITQIEDKTGCSLCGLTGHVAILFRQNREKEKRKIIFPPPALKTRKE